MDIETRQLSREELARIQERDRISRLHTPFNGDIVDAYDERTVLLAHSDWQKQERDALLKHLAAGPPSGTHTVGPSSVRFRSCCGGYAEKPHTEDCWWGITEAILARAKEGA